MPVLLLPWVGWRPAGEPVLLKPNLILLQALLFPNVTVPLLVSLRKMEAHLCGTINSDKLTLML